MRHDLYTSDRKCPFCGHPMKLEVAYPGGSREVRVLHCCDQCLYAESGCYDPSEVT